MPTYDYACKGCEHMFQARKPCNDRHEPTLSPCSECGGEVYIHVGSPMIVSGVKSPHSAPSGFKDVLREIKKGSGKGSTIDV